MPPEDVVTHYIITRVLDCNFHVSAVILTLCCKSRSLWRLTITFTKDTKSTDAGFLIVWHFQNSQFQETYLHTIFSYHKIVRQVGCGSRLILNHKVIFAIHRSFQNPTCDQIALLNITLSGLIAAQFSRKRNLNPVICKIDLYRAYIYGLA